MTDIKAKNIQKSLLIACSGAVAFKDSVLVFGSGPCPCKIMVIGEAPGRKETALKKPFVGRAGGFFMDILEDILGKKREDIYITNVVKIWPRIKTKRGRTRPPTKAEEKFFLPYLYKEIELVRPGIVLTVGKTAFRAILPSERFNPGKWLLKKDTGFMVMPVYHPAYILRKQRQGPKLIRGLKRALNEVKRRALKKSRLEKSA